MTTASFPAPSADARLADLAQRGPAFLAVISKHGMDACCGGALTVAQAAAAHKIPLETLLEELREAGRVES